MTWSLVEIRTLAIKAARGAGLSWGLAEEAGFAVRWLEQRGLAGVEALAAYLNEMDGYSPENCPIAQGAAISDTGEWKSAFPCETFQPILIFPFFSNALGEDSAGMQWNEKSVVLNSSGISGDISVNLISSGTQTVSIREGAISTPNDNRLSRVPDNREPFVRTLEKFAHRTYAPATEESRLAGAGAGLNDND